MSQVLGLVHWEDPEGWDGEGGSGWRTHVNPWLIHVNVWQKPLQYFKVISLELIKINEKKEPGEKNLPVLVHFTSLIPKISISLLPSPV